MKRGNVLFAGLVSALVVFVLSSGFSICSSTQPQQGGDPQSLVMNACTACHPSQKICDKLGTKDKDAWSKTVARMVEKGADIPSESVPLVVAYLSGLQPGSKPVCK